MHCRKVEVQERQHTESPEDPAPNTPRAHSTAPTRPMPAGRPTILGCCTISAMGNERGAYSATHGRQERLRTQIEELKAEVEGAFRSG
jgi:hypothetical protein